MLHIDEINAFEQVEPFAADWRELLSQTDEASFFHTPDWLRVYMRHSGACQKLRLLAFREEHRLVGLLPLVVRTERRRLGDVRVLTYPLDDWGAYYGPIGANPGLLLEAGLRHVRRTRRDWDLLELRWCGLGSRVDDASRAALAAVGLPFRTKTRDVTCHIELAGSNWEAYMASRNGKWRTNSRRWRRKIEELGQHEFVRVRPGGASVGDADPRWDIYDTCEDLARRSWQGSSANGTTLSHASVRQYLRDTHAVGAAFGAVDMCLLRLNGEPVAFSYNYVWNGSVFGLRVGYDAQASTEGLGNLLYVLTIEDAFARGDVRYDLGPGSHEIKRYLLTHRVPLAQHTHFRPGSAKAQLLRLKRIAGDYWRQSRARSVESGSPSVTL